MKGVYAYRKLIEKYGLQDKYPDINEGEKAKVIYLQKNGYGYNVLTYNSKYPIEVKSVNPDIDKMIERDFIKKIEMLLEPCGKMNLLDFNADSINFFF